MLLLYNHTTKLQQILPEKKIDSTFVRVCDPDGPPKHFVPSVVVVVYAHPAHSPRRNE